MRKQQKKPPSELEATPIDKARTAFEQLNAEAERELRAREDACRKELKAVLDKHRCVMNGTLIHNFALGAGPQLKMGPIALERLKGK